MCRLPQIRYGFTGTRDFDETNLVVVSKVTFILKQLETKQITEFTTGACRGIDDFIFRTCLKLYPNAWHRVIVPWNKSQVIIPAQTENVEIIYMPEGTTYRERNERIVDFTDELHAFPYSEGRIRSGTVMTINIAGRRGIPVKKHVLYG